MFFAEIDGRRLHEQIERAAQERHAEYVEENAVENVGEEFPLLFDLKKKKQLINLFQ